jgi:hypothetical protein
MTPISGPRAISVISVRNTIYSYVATKQEHGKMPATSTTSLLQLPSGEAGEEGEAISNCGRTD